MKNIMIKFQPILMKYWDTIVPNEEVLLHWIDYVIKWTNFYPQPRLGSGPLYVQWGLNGGWFDRFYQRRCSMRQSGTFLPLQSYFHKPLLSQAGKLRRSFLYCSASRHKDSSRRFLFVVWQLSLSMTHYIYDKLHCLYQRDGKCSATRACQHREISRILLNGRRGHPLPEIDLYLILYPQL